MILTIYNRCGVPVALENPNYLLMAKATVIKHDLSELYTFSNVERREYNSNCDNGDSYGGTVRMAVRKTGYESVLDTMTDTLYAMADWPNAGTIAWEMRRFMRYCEDRDLIAKMAEYSKVIVTELPYGEEMKGYHFLGCEDLYFNANYEDGTDEAKRLVEYLKGLATESLPYNPLHSM